MPNCTHQRTGTHPSLNKYIPGLPPNLIFYIYELWAPLSLTPSLVVSNPPPRRSAWLPGIFITGTTIAAASGKTQTRIRAPASHHSHPLSDTRHQQHVTLKSCSFRCSGCCFFQHFTRVWALTLISQYPSDPTPQTLRWGRIWGSLSRCNNQMWCGGNRSGLHPKHQKVFRPKWRYN